MNKVCDACGRGEGHWLNCPKIPLPEMDSVCAEPTCDDPVRTWSGRGARPKYCLAHSPGVKKEVSNG